MVGKDPITLYWYAHRGSGAKWAQIFDVDNLPLALANALIDHSSVLKSMLKSHAGRAMATDPRSRAARPRNMTALHSIHITK